MINNNKDIKMTSSRRCGVFIVRYEPVPHLFLVFFLLTLNMCECLKSYLLSENLSRNTFKKIRLEIYLRYVRESIISRSLSGNLLQQNMRILGLEF